MYVIKRDGREEKVHLDKITARISNLCNGLDMRFIDPVSNCAVVVASQSTSRSTPGTHTPTSLPSYR